MLHKDQNIRTDSKELKSIFDSLKIMGRFK